ncbi:MAG TPA: DNA mismatch repair protein MutS [Desulfuromonadales bacterium]|nr:DNA mismatch repair protein MutS [Desulfuromonadales bacterium]
MARKSSPNPPKPKQFHISPFGLLKGVAVSSVPSKKVEVAVQQTREEPVSGADLFLQAMSGVQPLTRATPAVKGKQPVLPKSQPSAYSIPAEDEASVKLFAQEIGRLKLDTKFTELTPDDGELQALAGNRLRQVKRGVVSVEHQLDLHGLTREEALEALPRFLIGARRRGQKAALIITGKGNHSAERPVLQQAVAAWLRDAGRESVTEFAPAPRGMGGSGAFVVFLRPVPSESAGRADGNS